MNSFLACRAIVAAALFTVSSLALSQDPIITYTTGATRLSKAVAEISRQAGKQLFVSPALENEPIVLRLKDVPLQQVLDKLGDEFVGEWTNARGGLELVRTDKVVDGFRKKLAEDRLTGIKTSIQDLESIAKSPLMEETEAKQIAATYVKMLTDEKNGTNTGDGMSMRLKLSNRTGDMRLLASMVLAIGAERIATLPRGRHVFSIEPTATQLPIEGLDPKILEQYVQQKNLLAKTLSAAMTDDLHDGYGDSAMFSANETVKAPIKVLVQISGDPDSGGSWWVTLNVYDAMGESVWSPQYMLGDGYNPQRYVVQRAKANAASVKEADIQLSPVDTELALRYGGRQTTIQPLTPAALERLTNPETFDPFSICFSDIWLTTAERENRNLIASAADANLRIAKVNEKGQTKVSNYELSTTMFGGLVCDRPDGWLVIKPKNPIAATNDRLNRSALSEFTRAYANKGYFSIEDWATLASHVSQENAASLAYMYQGLLRGDRNANGSNDWETLKFYGMLTDGEINTLSSGGELPFQMLAPEAKNSMNRMVYENMSIRVMPGYQPPGTFRQTATDMEGVQYPQGLDAEPTESAPNGLPVEGQIKARVDQKPLILVKEGTAGHMFEHEMPLEQLAGILVQIQDGPPMDPTGEYGVSGIRIGTKKTITFQMPLNQKVRMLSTLRENHFVTTDLIPLDKIKEFMPPDDYDNLQKKMESIRQMRKKYGNRPYTPPTSPPPPPL